MQEIVTIIQQVGFPIAAAAGLGWFIFKLIMRIVDGMENKLDVVDEKLFIFVRYSLPQATLQRAKAPTIESSG